MAWADYDYLNPRNYWCNRDPRLQSTVWMDNDAYARLKRDLAYYRRNPGKADPSKMLNLIGQIFNAWDGERRSFIQAKEELVGQYSMLINAMNARTDEIRHLDNVIQRLDRQLQEQERKQNKLQAQLDELISKSERNSQLANLYLNEAIEAYNNVVNDLSYRKFVSDQLESMSYLFQTVNNLELDSGAIQGLAIDALGKLFAMNKEVMRKRVEFDLMYDVVSSEAKDLQQQYNYWENNVYFDAENKNKADMAFWSYNLFPELKNSVERLCQDLDQAYDNPSIQVKELKEIQKNLETLREYGEQTVNDVLMRSLQSEKSEALCNIASLILVEDFLFKVVYMGFNNGDERSSYVAQLSNTASGMNIQFIFTPLGPSQIGCDYQVSLSGYQDETRVNTILSSIWQELSPNKINPSRKQDGEDSHIVDQIDFVKPGQHIHLPEVSTTNK